MSPKVYICPFKFIIGKGACKVPCANCQISIRKSHPDMAFPTRSPLKQVRSPLKFKVEPPGCLSVFAWNQQPRMKAFCVANYHHAMLLRVITSRLASRLDIHAQQDSMVVFCHTECIHAWLLIPSENRKARGGLHLQFQGAPGVLRRGSGPVSGGSASKA